MANVVQVAMRLPMDVKQWLKAEAERNYSTQNSEVVRALRERMARVEAQAADLNRNRGQDGPQAPVAQ